MMLLDRKIADEQERIDNRSFFALNVARHWFDYKLPKWLSVISELQEYVLRKHNLPFGNYSFLQPALSTNFSPRTWLPYWSMIFHTRLSTN